MKLAQKKNEPYPVAGDGVWFLPLSQAKKVCGKCHSHIILPLQYNRWILAYARLFLAPLPCEQSAACSKKSEPYPVASDGVWFLPLSQAKKVCGKCHIPFLAGIDGFEPSRCQSQSLVPYRLAISQFLQQMDYTTKFC